MDTYNSNLSQGCFYNMEEKPIKLSSKLTPNHSSLGKVKAELDGVYGYSIDHERTIVLGSVWLTDSWEGLGLVSALVLSFGLAETQTRVSN